MKIPKIELERLGNWKDYNNYEKYYSKNLKLLRKESNNSKKKFPKLVVLAMIILSLTALIAFNPLLENKISLGNKISGKSVSISSLSSSLNGNIAAENFESQSFSTSEDHIGLSGEKFENNIEGRTTLTYEQSSNRNASSESYELNVGWLSLSSLIPPEFLFISQNPLNITALNLFGSYVEITYNITDLNGIDENSVKIYHKSNSSISDCWTFLNGSYENCGYRYEDPSFNLSDSWTFRLYDYEIYPATYNLHPRSMRNSIHNEYILNNENNYLKIKFFNVSKKQYGGLELMVNASSEASAMKIYYCNESYDSGNPKYSDHCSQFASLSYNDPIAYQANYSYYHLIPFSMNIPDGKIGDVSFSETSYILLEGPVIGNWSVYYIQNISREDSIQSSNDNAISWSNFSGTVDAAIHQTETVELNYYLCAKDLWNNSNCSNIRTDILDKSPIPPSAPSIYEPSNKSYNKNINIKYFSALSPNGFDIANYSIKLLYPNESLKEIISENVTNLNYIWDSTNVSDGNYKLSIKACDIASQCSSEGYSVLFELDNSAPNISIINPAQNSILAYDSTSTEINISTDEYSECRYSIENESFEYENGTNFSSSDGYNHSFIYSGLSEGTSYKLYYKCNDSLGNINKNSTIHSFSVASAPSGGPAPCIPSWSCGPWTPETCPISGIQTRECDDGCGNSKTEERSCEYEPTCDDGVKNGDESDVDCGGSCDPCAIGKDCLLNEDCESFNCVNGSCAEAECIEEWYCSDWSDCYDGERTRECSDINECGTNYSKPETSEACCEDDTAPGECSLNQPRYCEDGKLIFKCSECGCPDNEQCQEDGSCKFICQDDDDCINEFGEGFECKNGECFAEEVECNSDNDCPSGKYCYHGICKLYERKEKEVKRERCIPNWNCSDWSECSLDYDLESLLKANFSEIVKGNRERVCVDLNECLPGRIESHPCVKEIAVRIERMEFCNEEYIKVYNKKNNNLIAIVKKNLIKPIYGINLGKKLNEISSCWYCSDSVKDYDEVYIDCGGKWCDECNLEEYKEWYSGESLELTMKEKDRIWFKVNNSLHSLSLLSINEKTEEAVIEINSESIKFNIKENEERTFDVNSDSLDDIIVILNKLAKDKAFISVKKVVPPKTIFDNLAPIKKVVDYQLYFSKWKSLMIFMLASILIAIGIIFRDILKLKSAFRKIKKKFYNKPALPEKPRFPIIRSEEFR